MKGNGGENERGRERKEDGSDCDKQMKLMMASVCLVKTGRSTVSGAMLNTPHVVK